MYFVAIFLLSTPAQASPKIAEVMPPISAKAEEVSARIGQLKRLKPDSPDARWELAAGTVGADIATDEKGVCVFSAERAGRYTLICYTNGPATWVVVTVGGVSPTPPPDPKPVDPLKPVEPIKPDPPKPDPIAVAIREAFAKDTVDGKQKREDAALLSALWEEGAKLTDDQTITAAGQLIDRVRRAGNSLAGTRLGETRKTIATATAKLFGSPDAPLTADSRKAAKELFVLFARTLEELSK